MQIVINIPDKYVSIEKSFQEMILEMNADGVMGITILPEGHGTLKDADELYSIFKEKCDAYNIDNLSFISDMDMNFDLAPTIIEANKKSEEPRQTLKSCKNCGYPYKLAGKCYSCDDYSQWIPIEADNKGE